MKVAIISDIHDNLVNLDKCLSWCRDNNIVNLICCGDVTNTETLGKIANGFAGTVFLVRGNMEIYEEGEEAAWKNINYLGRFGIAEIGGHQVGICHEPEFIGKIKVKNACDIIFYGHTHKPWIEEKNGVKIINPGTLGGVFQKATFAVWDSEVAEPELKILEEM